MYLKVLALGLNSEYNMVIYKKFKKGLHLANFVYTVSLSNTVGVNGWISGLLEIVTDGMQASQFVLIPYVSLTASCGRKHDVLKCCEVVVKRCYRLSIQWKEKIVFAL